MSAPHHATSTNGATDNSTSAEFAEPASMTSSQVIQQQQQQVQDSDVNGGGQYDHRKVEQFIGESTSRNLRRVHLSFSSCVFVRHCLLCGLVRMVQCAQKYTASAVSGKTFNLVFVMTVPFWN